MATLFNASSVGTPFIYRLSIGILQVCITKFFTVFVTMGKLTSNNCTVAAYLPVEHGNFLCNFTSNIVIVCLCALRNRLMFTVPRKYSNQVSRDMFVSSASLAMPTGGTG